MPEQFKPFQPPQMEPDLLPGYEAAVGSEQFHRMVLDVAKQIMDVAVVSTGNPNQYIEQRYGIELGEERAAVLAVKVQDELIATALAKAAASVLLGRPEDGMPDASITLYRAGKFAEYLNGLLRNTLANPPVIKFFGTESVS